MPKIQYVVKISDFNMQNANYNIYGLATLCAVNPMFPGGGRFLDACFIRIHFLKQCNAI